MSGDLVKASVISGVLAKASSLKSEIRLQRAITGFEANLLDKHKSTFQTLRSQSLSTTPSPSDVMQLTAEITCQTFEKYNDARFGPRFSKFLVGVQQFAELGDVVVGGSQNMLACGVWALVRMSLLSIVNLSTYIDKLSSLFMQVGRSTPCYQEIALLYPRSRKLQSYMNEYFIVVVDLCRYLFKFGQKSAVRQFASSLSDAHLKTFQTDLDKWASSIKEQMIVSETQESSGFRALTRDIFASTSRQQRHANKMRVLDFASTYDHETAWKQIRKAGNASFYRQHPSYQEWKDGSDSGPSTLVYTGKLGSGKSVLLANIVDDLNICTEKERRLVAYFFCKHDVSESLLARTIIGSLARQFLRTVPDLSVLAESCGYAHSTADTGKVLDMLFQGYSSDTKAYLIVDGLDECDEEEKETVVQALQKIQEKLEVRVCASFRETNNGLQSITNQLLVTRNVLLPEDNPDIEAFIEADLERCLRQKRLTIGDPALILNIQDALLQGSQGMFLWVTLQVQTLCTMKTDHAIRHALANLPKDLSETFTRILQKSGGGGSDLALQAKTLQLVLAARRPLTIDELREALSVIPGDATWDPSMVLNDVQSALACCGCLLTVDEEELTVRFVHNSVKQYIVNGLYSVNNTRSSLKEAQRMLADVLVTYLNYGVFGTELSRARAHPMLAQSAPSKIVQATMDSSSTAQQIAIKYLKTRRQHAVDMSRVITEARSSLKFKTEHAFRFHAYAEKYWQDHVMYVSGQESTIFKLTSKLIRSRASELDKLDKSFWIRFQWAAENGNRNVVMVLIQAGKIDTNATDNDGLTALMRAARDGYKDTVEVLLSLGNADVEARSNSGSTALMWAASNGHKETVEVLLRVGKANVEAKNNSRWTALMWAASNGHEDTVEVLLRVGKADVEARNNDGWTPLMWAASNGHEDTVEVLLRVGEADVEAKDNGRSTALMLAASEGHRGPVEVLLRVGKAEVEAKNNDGWTALMWAARDGHRKTVEVLLSLADVDAKNNNRWTALMWAASKGHKDTVEVLLTVGKADVEAKNNEGWTALDLAARNGHEDTCELLQLFEMANRTP